MSNSNVEVNNLTDPDSAKTVTVDSLSDKLAESVYGQNLLINFNFSVKTPDDTDPKPDATPRTYAADYQVFYGWFADAAVGVTGLTFTDGVINFTAGAIYQDYDHDGGIDVIGSAVIASVAKSDLIGLATGVTLTDTGTAWRVSITLAASDTLSAKLENGNKITTHTALNEASAFATAADGGLFQGVDYVDPDAEGTSKTARIHPDLSVTGKTSNGGYEKRANGTITIKGSQSVSNSSGVPVSASFDFPVPLISIAEGDASITCSVETGNVGSIVTGYTAQLASLTGGTISVNRINASATTVSFIIEGMWK